MILFPLCVLYTVLGLEMNMGREQLTGPQLAYEQVARKFGREFPWPDDLTVVVQSSNPERNRQFVERLAAKIRPATNLFANLFYKHDLTTLGPKGLLLASEGDLESFLRTLRDNRSFFKQLTQATNLDSLFSLINAQFLTGGTKTNAGVKFVINALPSLESIVTQAKDSLTLPGPPPPPGVQGMLGGGGEGGTQQSYVTFNQGQIYLLTVRARNNAANPAAIKELRRLMQETEPVMPGLNVGLTGEPVLDYDELRQSEHDTIVASIVSLMLCSMIFIVAFGQFARPLKAAVCLIIGLGLTMGFVTLSVGELNILTITFAPMLIGLAIDDGVHFISRYEEEMRRGDAPTEAVERTTAFTGQGIVTGTLTTAAAFFAMALTNFRGIRQMGVISGGGLLICLIPMITMLPVLLMRGRRQNIVDRRTGAVERRTQIENLWLERPWPTVLAALGLCAVAATQFHKVHFDYDLLHMQSKGLPAVTYEQLLIKSASQSSIFGTVLANDDRQARAFEARIKRLPSVASVQSAASFFSGDQAKKLELVREIKREVQDLHFAPVDQRSVQINKLDPTLWYLSGFLGLGKLRVQQNDPLLAHKLSSLREAIVQFRHAMYGGSPQIPERLSRFQQVLFEDLRHTFDSIKNQDTSGPLRAQDLPPSLRDRFIGVTGKYLVQVYPKKDIWQHENQREFIKELQSVIPVDRLDGIPVGLFHYTTDLKNSYQEAAWYALGAIIIMIFLHFRSLAAVILALLPVMIGSCWLLGFMGAAKVPFNPANIMTLPLMIGIGVTNGIQILNRLAEERRPGVLAKSTGKAVLVSGLTAITGFGSLILAKHQGIRSLGIVMSVGIASCMIAGLTFLPAFLNLLMRRGWTIKLG